MHDKQTENNFIKDDKDKPMVSLIEPSFILGIAKVLTYGVNKYKVNNWKKIDDSRRYKDALLRHILAYLDGENVDRESKLPHLHHAACNLMFLDWLDRNAKNRK